MNKVLLCAVTLACGTAHAHPGSVAVKEQVLAASPADPSSEAFDYYYRLFARLALESPAPNQPAMFAAMRSIVHRQHNLADAEDPAAILERLESHCAELKKQYPVVPLVWKEGGTSSETAIEPVAITRGLSRHILVEVHNQTAQSLDLNVFTVPEAPGGPPISIPSGATRLVPAHLILTTGSDAAEVALTLMPGSNPADARLFSVPVTVSAPAIIRGTIKEADTGEPFPGRVYVKGSDGCYRYGKAFAENTTLSVKHINELLTLRFDNHRLPFFYSDGHFEVEVPAGTTEITLERGCEHSLSVETLEVQPGETREVTLSSGRFLDMRKSGWYSGDTHVHWVKNSWDVNEDIDLLAMVQRAEDLRVANNLTLYQWRTSEQGGPFVKPDQFALGPVPGHDGTDYYIQMAEEYRNDMFYGHLVFLNLMKLIEPIATGQGSGGPPGTLDWPLNRWAIQEVHKQGGISIEAHNLGPFFRSDVPVNVISGLADSLDQLDPEHYYRFLDIGAHIPLSNGSDHPARTVGYARVYVKLDGEFTYDKWIDGIRKCRTFTTSGPLLFLNVNGADIGDEVSVRKGEILKVTSKAMSRMPLGNFQVVVDGKVVKEIHTSERQATLEFELPANESGWIVARCSQTDEYSAINGLNIAHTSAVYVTVDGTRVFRPEAAAFWIENMRQHAENVAANGHFENDGQRQEQLDYIHGAIEKLEKGLAGTAPRP